LTERLPGVQLVTLHVRPAVDPYFVATEEIMTESRKREFEEDQRRRSEALEAVYDTWSAANQNTVSAWREIVGDLKTLVANESRKAIVVVIGHSLKDHDRDAETAVHAALFDAKAAVLLAPPAAPKSIGPHPAVAWKSCDAAFRAVEASLAILLNADHVTVLMGTHDDDRTAARQYLEHVLDPLKPRVEMRRFDFGSRHIGEALLAEAQSAGADLLIMGAYSHSHLRELLLGGATRDVLKAAAMPVLLHH
jgi:nucleotide-binding universal stress UspA family protein